MADSRRLDSRAWAGSRKRAAPLRPRQAGSHGRAAIADHGRPVAMGGQQYRLDHGRPVAVGGQPYRPDHGRPVTVSGLLYRTMVSR